MEFHGKDQSSVILFIQFLCVNFTLIEFIKATENKQTNKYKQTYVQESRTKKWEITIEFGFWSFQNNRKKKKKKKRQWLKKAHRISTYLSGVLSLFSIFPFGKTSRRRRTRESSLANSSENALKFGRIVLNEASLCFLFFTYILIVVYRTVMWNDWRKEKKRIHAQKIYNRR